MSTHEGRGVAASLIARSASRGSATAAITADRGLRTRLRRAERRQKLRAAILIAPLIVFLALNFLVPIGLMLFRAVDDPEVRSVFPQTVAALAGWDGRALPSETIAATFVEELSRARGSDSLSLAANRLNYDISGFRTVLMRTVRQLPAVHPADPLQTLIAIDAHWGDLEYWGAIKRATGPVTRFYLLRSMDLRENATGDIAAIPQNQAIFLKIFVRTAWISLLVTVTCLVFGYPVAYLLATLPQNTSNLLMIFVQLPFWTSVLVRTTAWVVLLQTDGVVNSVLRWSGIISQPLNMIYNRVGVCIAMTHILLPFMILPLYSVMKGIAAAPMRAAISLGAHPFEAFLRVYLPQTVPGIVAGVLLVFISALGAYITPALIGGADDQMISYFIIFYTNQSLNWGMGGALSLGLLIATLLLYGVYTRLADQDEAKWR